MWNFYSLCGLFGGFILVEKRVLWKIQRDNRGCCGRYGGLIKKPIRKGVFHAPYHY
jgi:hypothetical protein